MGKKFEPTKVYGPNRPDPTRPASNEAGFISDKIETDNELTEILQGPQRGIGPKARIVRIGVKKTNFQTFISAVNSERVTQR